MLAWRAASRIVRGMHVRFRHAQYPQYARLMLPHGAFVRCFHVEVSQWLFACGDGLCNDVIYLLLLLFFFAAGKIIHTKDRIPVM